ncbi:uncharacterized protein LOC123310380 [Coccinella septempunctata]|uniref:uncharacterized protein LOC123310380 n=1 Tax=Coccinella septempunctata TaxID=41139 RepID=UPI001D095081|nr:uncharacterized protein LOC123310380 [Coccinella septempunctata]
MPLSQLIGCSFTSRNEDISISMSCLFKFICLSYIISLLEVRCDERILKRSLFFPTATVLQFTYGLSIPLDIEGIDGTTTILLSTCLQGNYDLPKKSSDLQVHDLKKRYIPRNIDTTKVEIYNYIIGYLESLDLNGQGCLARVVCEIAKYPLEVAKEDNVIEKIVQFVLTPSQGNFDVMDSEDESVFSALLLAEEHGKRNHSCELKYESCELSLSSLFTLFFIE